MIKKIFTVILMLSLCSAAFAKSELRNPQGRLGMRYKTEKYTPLSRTNITTQELQKIGSIIKEEEQKLKQEEENLEKAKIMHLKREKALKEQARKEAIAQMKQKEEAEREKQKAIAKKQKEEILAKQKAQEERLQAQKTQEREQARLAKEQAEQKLLQEKQRKAAEIEKQKLAKQQEKELLKKKQKEEKLALQQEKEEVATNERKENFFSRLTHKNAPKEVAQEQEEAPEVKEIQQTQPVTKDPVKSVVAAKKKSHQDYETRKIIEEVTNELNAERPLMLEELSTLWVSAVQKSDTVYFAIMKLSNPNGEAVNEKGIKKILQPIVNAAPLVGQAFVNPALTAGSLIGSNVLGTMMSDSANKRLTKVNDADLVILARAIDELQETLLTNYMAYKSALKEYELAVKIADERKKAYDKLNSANSPHIVLASTFYTEAMDNQYKARQDFLMKRVVLEQMVGAEALSEIEKKTDGVAAAK